MEQFLGGSADGTVISWIEIRPTVADFQIWHFEVCDEDDDEFLDLYSFSPASGDWPDSPVSIHISAEEAVAEATRAFRADPTRWVNQFLIQDEYRDYLPSGPKA